MAASFAQRLLDWFDRCGRHDLPWQHPRNAYRVWLSEVMLQQTQVSTVIGYFERFVLAIPDLPALAAADPDRVLALWSGLGYYSRARNLHKAARICVERHGGDLPRDVDALLALPGIGRSTAGAILAQALELPFPILDGNVKRVLSRQLGLRDWPGQSDVERQLWEESEARLPRQRLADYTQALMDLGATVCKRQRPLCSECPVADACLAKQGNLQAEIPARKPRKTSPQRETIMLWITDNQGRTLLQRRPPSGIWGGLWSLPEASSTEDVDTFALRFGAVRADVALIRFQHVFSHFKLNVTVQRFHSARPIPRANEAPSNAWFAQADLYGLGLPAPVRRLVENCEES